MFVETLDPIVKIYNNDISNKLLKDYRGKGGRFEWKILIILSNK